MDRKLRRCWSFFFFFWGGFKSFFFFFFFFKVGFKRSFFFCASGCDVIRWLEKTSFWLKRRRGQHLFAFWFWTLELWKFVLTLLILTHYLLEKSSTFSVWNTAMAFFEGFSGTLDVEAFREFRSTVQKAPARGDGKERSHSAFVQLSFVWFRMRPRKSGFLLVIFADHREVFWKELDHPGLPSP